METNTSMTLFMKSKNDTWIRKLIEFVNWQGGHGASLDIGFKSSNDVKVWIPKHSNDLTDIKFSIGDIIVKGEVQPITSERDLKDYADVYKITTIVDEINGSEEMQHWYLGGK